MKEEKKRLILTIVTLWIASILGVTVCVVINEASTINTLKFGLLAIIFNAIFTYYLEIFQDRILNHKFAWWLLGVGYLSSVILICNPYEIGNYPFWLFGIVLIAIYVDTNLSLIMTYSIIFMAIGLSLYQFDEIIIPLVLGTFLCLMGKFLTNLRNLFYLIILILSLNVTMLFVIHGFNVQLVENKQSLWMVSSNLLILLVVYGITKVCKVTTTQESNQLSESDDKAETAGDGTTNHNESANASKMITLYSADNSESCKTQDSSKADLKKELIAAVSTEAPLIQLLEKESDKLYQHSKLVATVAKKAAKTIGADENLACAGGWYHEIGRLKGKDYITHGVELVEEYHLPNEIKDLIRQHSYKVEVPKSMEAVIVMLTDNFISTITYLKNNPDTKIASEKVVENTFSVLMNKGTFNEAKIDIGRFVELKKFYQSVVNELM